MNRKTAIMLFCLTASMAVNAGQQKTHPPVGVKQQDQAAIAAATTYTVASVEDGPVVVLNKSVDNFAVGGKQGSLNGSSKQTVKVFVYGIAPGTDMEAAKAFIKKSLQNGFKVGQAYDDKAKTQIPAITLPDGQSLSALLANWSASQAAKLLTPK